MSALAGFHMCFAGPASQTSCMLSGISISAPLGWGRNVSCQTATVVKHAYMEKVTTFKLQSGSVTLEVRLHAIPRRARAHISQLFVAKCCECLREASVNDIERLQHYGALGGEVPLYKPKWPNLLSSHYRRIANFPFQKTYYANNCSVGDNSFR